MDIQDLWWTSNESSYHVHKLDVPKPGILDIHEMDVLRTDIVYVEKMDDHWKDIVEV